MTLSRRGFLAASASLALGAWTGPSARRDDAARLGRWLAALREEGLAAPGTSLGPAVARAGELALGTPYLPHTLEAYLERGGSPRDEPLLVRLDVFDCVTLVEAAVAAARTARVEGAGWSRFVAEVERMRYRDGRRLGYASRLHYFSEWISDGARRGLLRDLGPELEAEAELRPLRFMSRHRASYRALADEGAWREVAERERALDGAPRLRVPPAGIAAAAAALCPGDVLAFATGIEGLDVTHTGLAHPGPDGIVRVLHAPLSGGVVQVSRGSVAEYVAALRGCTGILVARPLAG
jgi:hypothetical protein